MAASNRSLGPYRLLRRIGSGGMAEVYLGERLGEEGFSRSVAIKTIATNGGASEAMNLFIDEARVAAYLAHPAIVQTFDLGYENDTLFIAMEYVAGPPLSRIIKDLKKRRQFLNGSIVALIGARVASALDYAYERAAAPDGRRLEMIHRDISPQNILLTRVGSIKLTDFGVARASIQTHRTRTGQVRGKSAYMAPEQVRAKELTGRTDVFALGLVLYESLTNIRTYQRKTDINSMRAILTDDVAPIANINPDAAPDLVDVVMRALQKDPNQRPSAREFERALLDTLKTSTVEIETAIGRTIDGLFGRPETYGTDEGRPVESWQPTIAAESQDIVPKLPRGQLTPDLERMLRTDDGLETPTAPTAPPPTRVTRPTPTKPTRTAERSRLSGFTDQSSLRGIGLPVLAVLLAVVGALGVMLWRERAPQTAAKTAVPAETAEPRPVDVRPKPVRLPPPPRPDKPVRVERVFKTTKKKVRAPTKKAAPPPAPPRPTKSFRARVLAAAEGHEARGNTKLAKSLRSLLFTLTLRPPNATERKTLAKAEKDLR